MAPKQQTVTMAGHKLKLTNLDKVLYPETETTKAEVIEYLQTIAPAMLPHVRRLEDSAPTWVPRLGLQHSDHVNTYPLAKDEAVLAWFASSRSSGSLVRTDVTCNA